tara:strand:+ start:8096 stop:8356 length:261 start_codon:yes stop_codon:yes gene_type:complete
MKKADIKYVTMINGDDGWTTVHAYSSIKNAKTKALDYVKSFEFDNLAEYGREVSDFGVVLSVMSLKQFEERCAFNLIPEYELCMGY